MRLTRRIAGRRDNPPRRDAADAGDGAYTRAPMRPGKPRGELSHAEEFVLVYTGRRTWAVRIATKPLDDASSGPCGESHTARQTTRPGARVRWGCGVLVVSEGGGTVSESSPEASLSLLVSVLEQSSSQKLASSPPSSANLSMPSWSACACPWGRAMVGAAMTSML